MESLIQVLEACLLDLGLPQSELECWQQHIDLIALLNQDSFSTTDLDMIHSLALKWKRSMVQLYGDFIPPECTKTHKRKKHQSTRHKKPLTPAKPPKPLSFNFPNIETIEHWRELIDFLGPPWFQSTKLWEQRHLVAKATARRTNMRNITRDVLTNV